MNSEIYLPYFKMKRAKREVVYQVVSQYFVLNEEYGRFDYAYKYF